MSKAPKELWADWDYEATDGVCGVHTHKKYASGYEPDLPPIRYVRADRIEELEAKLAKVATRLQHIAANKISDELSVVEWDTHDTFSILDGCILSARATLAELKGQDDE